ncbi:hypothetical protein GGD56_006575 [Rhizobium mongolense]|uniref:Uncharacterized protein n=1 Tax=Rhizobium mongolense TaxID=57676 RepID=A0ABR6IXM6_9HYPH|nr:hypothetical protein [Rhizobium mongolense]
MQWAGGWSSSGIIGQSSPSAEEKMLRWLEKVSISSSTLRWSRARVITHVPRPSRVLKGNRKCGAFREREQQLRAGLRSRLVPCRAM